MDNCILKNLLKEYEKKRIKNIQDLDFRKKDLYKKVPRLEEIEKELSTLSISASKSILLSNDSNVVPALKEKIQELKKEKIKILKENKIPLNFLSVFYDCPICQDTGYIYDNYGSKMCNCLKQKILDIQYNKSCISNSKNQTFDNFNPNLYANKVDKEKFGEDVSPRQNILEIKKACQIFIKNFDSPDAKNLLFSGGTGLR